MKSTTTHRRTKPRHGTLRGYREHLKRGTAPCLECLDALTMYRHVLSRRKLLGLPMRGDYDADPPRWVRTCGDMTQIGAAFYAGVAMNA